LPRFIFFNITLSLPQKKQGVILLKKLSFIISVLILAAAIPPLFAPDGVSRAAAPRYARIAEDGIILYTIDSGYEFRPLFALPKTYYVEYTGRSNSKYHIVKYMDLKSGLNNYDLFILKNALNVEDSAEISSPYPSVTVRNSLSGENLYSLPDEDSALTATVPESDAALTYYGSTKDDTGAIWHYAAYNGVCGYIREAALVEAPTIPPHPNSAPPSTDTGIEGGGTANDTMMTLILTAGIILPAVIIFLLMFRPIKRRALAANTTRSENRRPRPRSDGYYTDKHHHSESDGYYTDKHPHSESDGYYTDKHPRSESDDSYTAKHPRSESDGYYADKHPRSESDGYYTDKQSRSRSDGYYTDKHPHSESDDSYTAKHPRSQSDGYYTDKHPRSQSDGYYTDKHPRSESDGYYTDKQSRRGKFSHPESQDDYYDDRGEPGESYSEKFPYDKY
jgi:hypothetical protein